MSCKSRSNNLSYEYKTVKGMHNARIIRGT